MFTQMQYIQNKLCVYLQVTPVHRFDYGVDQLLYAVHRQTWFGKIWGIRMLQALRQHLCEGL